MKKIFPVVITVILALFLAACSAPQKEITNIANYKNWSLELKSAEKYKENEELLVKVHAVYTNNSSEPLYALSSFAVRAFQNDVEIEDCSDINGNEASLIREIKNGKSLDVEYVFKLTDDSEVEVLVGTPTADMETVGQATYFKQEN